jgi:DNA-binding transcriptional MerR regulator
MLRIGAFARLAGVSVKVLRFYSDLGLVRPSAVDPRTGYRHYETAQLESLRRIQALRELGFSLREVWAIQREPRCLVDRLRRRRDRAAEEVLASSRRLARLEDLLLGGEGDPLGVRVHRVPPFHGLGARNHLADYSEIDGLFERAERNVPRGVKVCGRVAAWYPQAPRPGRVEAEALLEVDRPCPGSREWAGGEVASTTYAGEAWAEPFARLAAWLDRHRFALAGPKREHLFPGGLVEVRFPIRPEARA